MLPKRKKLRLSDYDYSTSGCYFVTICTYNGQYLFCNAGNLTAYGKIVEEEIQNITKRYFDIKIDNFIIMPNHIHLMVTIGCDALPDNEEVLLNETLGRITHNRLDVVLGLFKSGVTRRIHKITPATKVWQRSYYDHIIRNKKDYNETWDYIEANPIRWEIKHHGGQAGQDPPLQ